MEDSSSNLLPLFLLKQDITRAFVYFAVFSLSALLVWTAYLNYVLLQPYFAPIFWALVVSIPLHSLKYYVLVFTQTHFESGGSVPALLTVMIKVGFKLLVGPLWIVFEYLFSTYFALVASISSVSQPSRHLQSISKRKLKRDTDSASPSSSRKHSSNPATIHQSSQFNEEIGVIESSAVDEGDIFAQNVFDTPSKNSSRRFPQSIRNRTMRNSVGFGVRNDQSTFGTPRTPVALPLSKSADDIRYRTASVSEKIVGSLKQAHSTKYFSILIRLICLYLISLVIMMLEPSHYTIALTIIGVAVAFHVSYHLLTLLIFKLLQTRLFSLVSTSTTFYVVKTAVNVSIVMPFTFLYSLVDLFHDSCVQLMRKNINLMVTSFLFMICIFFMVIISGFTLFKLIQEGNAVIEAAVNLVNYSISSTDEDQELAQRFRQAMSDVRTHSISWGNERLKESFPNLNLTLPELYSRVYESSVHLRNYISGDQSIFHQTSSSFSSIGNSTFKSYFSNFLNITTTVLNADVKRRQAIMSFITEVFYGHVRTGFLAFVGAFTYAFNFTIDLTIFSLLTFYLTLNEHSPVYYASQVLLVIDSNHRLRMAVERAIRAVFLSTLKMAVFHFLFTWLSFNLAGLEFVYFYSVLGCILAVVPVISPFWIVIVPCIQLVWQRSIWKMLTLALSHLWVMLWADAAIYSDIPDSNQYVIAYSIILGLWAYGWKGLVIGPVLASLPVLILTILSELTAAPY